MARNLDGTGRKPHKWRGRWRAYLTVGYKGDGRPERRYVYGDTADECQAKLDALRREKADGGLNGAAPGSLGAWLETWLSEKARSVKPRTLTIYRQDTAHLPAKLLKTRVDRITPLSVQAALSRIADDVSPRASRAARKVLQAAMRDAVRLGVLARNPVAVVPGVAYQPQQAKVWTAAEVMRFIETCRERRSWYLPLFYTALTTGARMGELFALRWSDVEATSVVIERTSSGHGRSRTVGAPKTRAGRRRLPISSDLGSVLESHRMALTLRSLPNGDDAPVFPSEAGTLLTYSNTRRALHHWADRAEVPRIRPHDLRHTFASMAISQGMSPADLARQLGHSDAGFTLRQYVHFFERATPRAALSLAELTGASEAAYGPEGGTIGGTTADEPS